MAGFEQMDKLLLRAQVLQQSALETLEKSVAGLEKWRAEAIDREKRFDERVDKLVASIADLIRRIPPENLR
jgi:hypothetical protein